MTEPLRLSKRLVELVGCSRREAELYIEGGWVKVDGQMVDEPQFKVTTQQVELHPKAQAVEQEPVTLLLNAPAGINPAAAMASLSAASLSPEHRFSKRPLRAHFMRLSASCPLQPKASGLLVFTQDWRILRKLTTDAARVEQEYLVEVSGEMVEQGLERLHHGVDYKGIAFPSVKASWQSENRLRFALKNPHPGDIVLLCEAVGLKVSAIRRVRIGGVSIGKVPLGQWRYLSVNEKF